MPETGDPPTGAPVWVDLFTSDPDRARAFYGELFGLASEAKGPEYGGYVNFSKGDALVAGCVRNDGRSGRRDAWNVYLKTDDIDATLAAVVEHGGRIVTPASRIGDLGTAAFVLDPGGAAVGVWEPRRHAGFGILSEPGAPSWFELRTRAYDATVGFYRDVFRWQTQAVTDTSDFPYTMLVDGDDGLAGIADSTTMLGDDARAHWSIYFGTADTDATLARTVALGGAVVSPAQDTPYGRLAVAADPMGATFSLMKSNA